MTRIKKSYKLVVLTKFCRTVIRNPWIFCAHFFSVNIYPILSVFHVECFIVKENN